MEHSGLWYFYWVVQPMNHNHTKFRALCKSQNLASVSDRSFRKWNQLFLSIDPSAGPCILFRNWLIWLDSFDKSQILISTEMVWPGQFWQMECFLCLFRIKSSVKHSWALSLSYTNSISYTKRLSRPHLLKGDIHTIPDGFRAGAKTIPDWASVHT